MRTMLLIWPRKSKRKDSTAIKEAACWKINKSNATTEIQSLSFLILMKSLSYTSTIIIEKKKEKKEISVACNECKLQHKISEYKMLNAERYTFSARVMPRL